MQALAAETKVITELTCWKCGEESLKETAPVEEKHGATARIRSSGMRHSSCQKCGAHSINAAQSQHNRVLARTQRKAIIKESNRKSG
jgi:ribosomal protein L37E